MEGKTGPEREREREGEREREREMPELVLRSLKEPWKGDTFLIIYLVCGVLTSNNVKNTLGGPTNIYPCPCLSSRVCLGV
jgi:hypothetical protein